METYVCLLIGRDREILTVNAFAAETDALACARAIELADQPGICGYQLWRKGTKIAGRYRDDGSGGTPSDVRGT